MPANSNEWSGVFCGFELANAQTKGGGLYCRARPPASAVSAWRIGDPNVRASLGAWHAGPAAADASDVGARVATLAARIDARRLNIDEPVSLGVFPHALASPVVDGRN